MSSQKSNLSKHILLVFCFLLFTFSSFAQQKKVYTQFAEEAFADGDFHTAAEYYLKLYEKDSTVDYAYLLGESYRGYNAFKQSLSFYSVVLNAKEKDKYPFTLYYVALLNKQLENYLLSEKQFTQFVKESKDKSSFQYKHAQQEVSSFKQVYQLLKDTIKTTVCNVASVNTNESEFGALIPLDSVLLYSALRKTGKDFKINIYSSVGMDTSFSAEQLMKEWNIGDFDVANATFNSAKNKIVYSKCDKNKQCKLVERQYVDTGWTAEKLLPVEINAEGFTATQPYLLAQEGKEILLFVSDMPGGKGKLDVWYSKFENNTFSKPTNIGAQVNSPGNEITPYYDVNDTALYFSSDWWPNLGSQDIFYCKGLLSQLKSPVNAGIPINSSRNDKCYWMNDATHGYITSTRVGTKSDDADAICCSDIYAIKKVKNKDVPKDTLPYKLIEAYMNLPLVLYFHNDEPNPRTRDTLSKFTYMETYNEYHKLVPDYLSKYPVGMHGEDSALARADIARFFTDYVDLGVEDLQYFVTDLLKYIQQGYSAEVLIKGFASPLTTTNYNVNLSLRRISTLMNYLRVYDNGVFVPYLNGTASNGAKITFIKNPNGEYKSAVGVSDDYYDTRNSIYNPHAAIERRIEVVRVNLIPKEPKEIPYYDNFKKMEIELDTISGESIKKKIYLKNTSDKEWTIQDLGADCSCTQLSWDKNTVLPGDYLTLQFEIDLKGKVGEKHQIINLKKSNNEDFQLIELKYFVKPTE